MNKERFSKSKLTSYLLMVSIVTVSLIGLYVLNLLAANLMRTIGSAARAVLVPFFLAFFLSFIVGPLARLIEKKFRLKRSAAIVLSIFIAIILIVGILFLVVSFMIAQIITVFSALLQFIDGASYEAFIRELIGWIQGYIDETKITDLWQQVSSGGLTMEKVFAYLSAVFVFMGRAAGNLFEALFSVVLTPVFLYYLIKEKGLIFTSISKAFPKNIRHHVVELGKRSEIVIGQFFRGSGLMMLTTALYFSVTLSILSLFVPGFLVGYAIAFGLISGLMTIIPYIGAWLSFFIPLIFLLTKQFESQYHGINTNIYLIAMIVVIIIYLLEQLLEGSIVQPYVMNKQVHIHPLVLISSLIFFGGIFGFIGVLLAVPIAGLLRAFFKYIHELNEPKKIAQPLTVD